MIALIRTSVSEKSILAFLILIGLIGGTLVFVTGYFGNSNVLMGLLLVPFSLFIEGNRRNNLIYAGIAVAFAALTAAYGLKIFYFFTLAFYFLWLTEFFYGKLNIVVLFLLVFMSPIFVQVITILGFPLRLLLSEYAGSILNAIGTDVRVEGNMMVLNDITFSVDEACMGLNMMATSMLMGVSVLIYRYRITKKFAGLFSTSAFFIVAFMLNMIANLIRIIALVYFKIPPEDPMHELTGIACLICYVIVPLYLISGWFVTKFATELRQRDHVPIKMNALLIVLPVVIILVGATFKRNYQVLAGAPYANVEVAEGRVEKLEDGITKISSGDWLIYVKTTPEFFTGEHTPLMCWKGSGYQFSGVTTVTIDGATIYKGTLKKDGDLLHTAWWYNNGQVNTISQLEWRTRMLKGEDKFCLVNVTSRDEERLIQVTRSILKKELMEIKD